MNNQLTTLTPKHVLLTATLLLQYPDIVRGQGVVRLIGDLAVAEVVGEAGVGGEA